MKNIFKKSCISSIIAFTMLAQSVVSPLSIGASVFAISNNLVYNTEAPDQDTTDGDQDTTDGDQDTTDGDQDTTDGDQDTTDGDQDTTDGDQDTTDGDQDTTDGDQDTTDGDQGATDGDQDTTDGDQGTTPDQGTAPDQGTTGNKADKNQQTTTPQTFATFAMSPNLMSFNFVQHGGSVHYPSDDNSDISLTSTAAVEFSVSMTIPSTAVDKNPTLTIVVPQGLELITAPYITGLDSNGNLIYIDAVDTAYDTYFDGNKNSVTFTKDANITGSKTFTTKSGKLTYNLANPGISGKDEVFDFWLAVRLDSSLLNYGDITDDYIGSIKIYYSDDNGTVDEELVSPELVIDRTKFTTFTTSVNSISATEVDNGIPGTNIDNRLVLGEADSVNMSAQFIITNNAYYTSNIGAVEFKVAIPLGATYVLNSSCTKLDEYDNGVNTYITIRYDNPKFSYHSTGSYSLDLNTYLRVKFPSETFGVGEYSYTVSDCTVYINVFDKTIDETGKNITIKSVSMQPLTSTKSITRVVEIYEDPHDQYYPSIWNNTSDNSAFNESTDNQLLFAPTRTMLEEDYTNVAYVNTTIPTTMTYTQEQVGGAYLDNVKEVVFASPFLGDSHSYSASINSITVTYSDNTTETYDKTNFPDNANWTATTDGKGYYPTYFSIDTTHIANLGSFAEYKSEKYTYTVDGTTYNSLVSSITVKATTGKSIVGVEISFNGDNSTFTNGKFYVWGRPVDENYTGKISKHKFDISSEYTDKDKVTTTKTTTSGSYGFVWKKIVEFKLDQGNYTMTNVVPTYGTYNYFIAQDNIQINTSSLNSNPRGYAELGMVGFRNSSGSENVDNIVVRVDLNENLASGQPADQVKLIGIPYDETLGDSQIVSIEYGYTADANDDKSPIIDMRYDLANDNSTIPYYRDSALNNIRDDSFNDAVNQRFMVAPDGYTFAYVEITYSQWTTSDTWRNIIIKGYIDGYDLTKNGYDYDDRFDIHEVSYSYNSDSWTNYTGKGYYDITTNKIGVGLSSAMQAGDTIKYDTLISNKTNTLEYQFYKGDSWYSPVGARDITIQMVLPDGIEVTGASMNGLEAIMSNGSYASLLNKSDMSTTDYEITTIGTLSATEANEYFGITAANGFTTDDEVSGATVWQIKPTNEYLTTYPFYGGGYNIAAYSVSVSIDVGRVSEMKIPYEKVFFAGSETIPTTLSGYSSGYVEVDGAKVINAYDGTYYHNFEYSVGINSDYYKDGANTKYIEVLNFDFFTIHDSHLEVDGEEYKYDSITDTGEGWIYKQNANGSLNFSISNYVDGSTNDTAYVYYPLPTSDNVKSSLMTHQQDFDLKVTGDATYATTGSGNVEIKYLSMTAEDLENANVLISHTGAEAYFDNADDKYSASDKHNTIIIKAENLTYGVPVDVSIPIQFPNNITDSGIIDISGFATYSKGKDSYAIYSGGTGEEIYSLMGRTVETAYVGNNPMRFSYEVPVYDIDYIPYVLLNDGSSTSMLTTDVFKTGSGVYEANYGTEYVYKNLPEILAPDGIEFKEWRFGIGGDIFSDGDTYDVYSNLTLYAEFEEISYTVEYYVDSSIEETRTGVSWSTLNMLPSSDATISGREFYGWSTVQNDKSKIIDSTLRYQDIVSDSSVKTLQLYAVYDVLTYDIIYYGTSIPDVTGVYWDDKITLPDETLLYKEGQTFLGWVSQEDSDYDVDDTMTFGQVYKDIYTGTSKSYITLVPEYDTNKYEFSYKVDGTVYKTASHNWTVASIDLTKPTTIIEGQTFLGWSWVDGDESQIITGPISVKGLAQSLGYTDATFFQIDIVLYAIYTDNEYQVTYNFNSGVHLYAPEDYVYTSTAKWGDLVYDATLFDGDGFFKAGDADDYAMFNKSYTFDGWYDNPEYSGTKIADVTTIKVSDLTTDDSVAGVTLYAKYTLVRYTVVYDVDVVEDRSKVTDYDNDIDYLLNNASFYERSKQDAATFVLPSDDDTDDHYTKIKGEGVYDYTNNEFVLDGYTFDGWSIVEKADKTYGYGTDAQGEIFDWGSKTSATYVVTEKSLFYEAHGYTASNYKAAVAEPINVIAMPGALTVQGTFTPEYFPIEYVVNESTTLSGVGIPEYVTWKGQSLLSTSIVPDIADVPKDMEFVGWYTSDEILVEIGDNLSDVVTYADINTTDGITLYAKFDYIKYDVTFKDFNKYSSADVTDLDTVVRYTVEDYIDLSYTKDGYTLTWFDADVSGTFIPDYSDMITETQWTYKELHDVLYGDGKYSDGITIYAKWVADISVSLGDGTGTEIVVEVESDDQSVTGTGTGSYEITNWSVAPIVFTQKIVVNEDWEFANGPIKSNDTTKHLLYVELTGQQEDGKYVAEVFNLKDLYDATQSSKIQEVYIDSKNSDGSSTIYKITADVEFYLYEVISDDMELFTIEYSFALYE